MQKPDRLWDWLAGLYERTAKRDSDLLEDVERLGKLLREQDTVLDLGCGSGVVACRIAPLVGEVRAIDTSRRMIQIARRKQLEGEVHFECQTVFDEALQQAAYDVILAFNILHLVPDPAKVLHRAAQLLKPQGRLVSVTPCMGEAGLVLRTCLPLLGKLLLSQLHFFKLSDVQDLVRDAGLKVLEAEDRGLRGLFLVAQKE
jgi:2-polyprenyl-3-methyl-5-hydroxy-6-metoxy-1,4-benzoquinol methylase